MLYAFMKVLIRLTLNAYFRHFTVKGLEHVPKEDPVIFVANHPSAFMDPLAVAVILNRSLHFIAAAEFFGKGLRSWLFRKHFNMIPVYRPNTRPGEGHKNEAMFDSCYEHLAKNGALLIFPEGVSETVKRLLEIKTGVARIALGAEDRYARELGVKIVPVGLNYSNPHQFRSHLHVHVGEPIEARSFFNEQEDNREAISNLTQEVGARLQESILHVQDEKLDTLVEQVDAVYRRDLMEIVGIDQTDAASEFKLKKDLNLPGPMDTDLMILTF